MTLAFEMLCLLLAYSAFCRAVHVGPHVLLRVRLVVTLVGAAAFGGILLPFYGWVPDLFHVVLVTVMWLYMTAFAKAWPPRGAPEQLQRRPKTQTP